MLFVDLAVPRDIDPALAAIDGCFVYDVDDLEAVVAASLAGRRAEAVRAERIVAAEAERFREWQASLAVVPAIASLRAQGGGDPGGRARAGRGAARRLPEAERHVVETVTAQIVNKLLHLPTVRMKEAAVTPDGVVYADVVRHLSVWGRTTRRDAAASSRRPLPLHVPTAFVRIRPRGPASAACRRRRLPRCRAASRRIPR